MATLEHLANEIMIRINRLRKIHRIIHSDLFIKLYNKVNDCEKLLANRYIDSNSASLLDNWIISHRKKHIETMTVAQLRKECALKGIRNYHLLQKDEMVQRIERLKND